MRLAKKERKILRTRAFLKKHIRRVKKNSILYLIATISSSVLAWRIPGTGEPGGLPSIGSHRVGHNRSNLAAACEIILSACIAL